MTTLEKCMKTTATKEDLNLIIDIRKGLKLFRLQYEYITWFNNHLEFKEYKVLEDDFSLFYISLLKNQNEFELYILQSLHRSFQLLHHKVLQVQPTKENMFSMFLHQATIHLRNIINSVTEPGE